MHEANFMILGIGVDSVEIERFSHWSDYSEKKLSRIFSPEEIKYCLQHKNKSAERFAARFAAREALFKALSYAYPNFSLPFLSLCARVAIIRIDGRPYVAIVGDLGVDLSLSVIHLSLSHTRTDATAFVVIERSAL